MTAEFRHRTATQTFLDTPARSRVVLAKLVTYGLAGAGFGLVCAASTVAMAVPYLAAEGVAVDLAANGIPTTLLAVVAAVALYAMLGVGLGAVLRDQVATAAGLLLYLFVVEPVVTRIGALRSWTEFLPGSAAGAMTDISQAGQEFLSPVGGALVLATYAAGIGLLGLRSVSRRDVR